MDVLRAAFDGWEIVLTGDGVWEARLPGGERVVAGTLARLAEALNEFVAGSGRQQ